ncbi:MAG TPA: DUF4397 domain-containing protein [Burkholderiaceae bacterium]|nr:DUF4397 domain-containing protein [Burkholderiaceae bacterium]
MARKQDLEPRDESRRFALKALGAVGLGAALSACGGAEKRGSIRVVNALASRHAIDVYNGNTLLFSSIAAGDASSGKEVDNTSVGLNVRDAGGSVNAMERTLSLNEDHRTTAIVSGTDNNLGLSTFVENEGAPDGGYAKLRLINTLQSGDALDLYLTTSGDDLSSQSPVVSNIGKGATSSFRTLANGTYRLRLTTSGDRNEVRLDVASFTVTDKQVVTFLATPTASATLANGLSLVQGGAATRHANTHGRVRFVNGASADATAQASVDGVSRATVGGWGVGSYSLIQEGSRTITFHFNSQDYSQQFGFEAGTDRTVALASQNGTVSIVTATDENLPSATSDRFKMRLVNLAEGIGSVQLTYNSGSVIADYTTSGQFSAYRDFTSGTYDFKATAGGLTGTIEDASVASSAVYSAFVFGVGSIGSFAIIRDR